MNSSDVLVRLVAQVDVGKSAAFRWTHVGIREHELADAAAIRAASAPCTRRLPRLISLLALKDRGGRQRW